MHYWEMERLDLNGLSIWTGVFCTYYRELRTIECTYYREMTVDNFNNILQAEAEKLSGFTPSIIQPEAAGRGLYARCKTR